MSASSSGSRRERWRSLQRELGEGPEPDALDRLRAAIQLTFPALARPSGDRAAKLEARCAGFSLEAGRHLHENDRRGLESLLQYVLRPPVAQERLTLAEDGSGEVVLKLKRPMADGRTSLRMAPLDLLRRLAGLIPPPRVHHISYFGAFAGHASLRARIVPHSPKLRHRCRMDETCSQQLALPLPVPSVPRLDDPDVLPLVMAPAPRPRELDWRSLLKRTFASDLFDCRCGGRRRVVAFVADHAKAVEVLASLGLPTEPPRIARARAPPAQEELFDQAPAELAAGPICPDV